MDDDDPDEISHELDAVGEEVVRKKLAFGAYNARKARIVEAWLEAKDRARTDALAQDNLDASRGAAAEAAKSAAAAERAASATERQAKMATIAVWVSGGALILSALALLLNGGGG